MTLMSARWLVLQTNGTLMSLVNQFVTDTKDVDEISGATLSALKGQLREMLYFFLHKCVNKYCN